MDQKIERLLINLTLFDEAEKININYKESSWEVSLTKYSGT